MNTSGDFRIVILHPQCIQCEILCETAKKICPNASISMTHCLFIKELPALSDEGDVLIIGCIYYSDGCLSEFMDAMPKGRFGRVSLFVLVEDFSIYILFQIMTVRPEMTVSLFDCRSERLCDLGPAIASAARNQRFVSQALVAKLYFCRTWAHELEKMLTPRERVVFSLLGSGVDDVCAADELRVCPSYIHIGRTSLHKKMNLHHKGELVMAAFKLGYARQFESNVIRPGYRILRKNWQQKYKARNEKETAL